MTWYGKLFVFFAAVGLVYMTLCTIIITVFVLAMGF